MVYSIHTDHRAVSSIYMGGGPGGKGGRVKYSSNLLDRFLDTWLRSYQFNPYMGFTLYMENNRHTVPGYNRRRIEQFLLKEFFF